MKTFKTTRHYFIVLLTLLLTIPTFGAEEVYSKRTQGNAIVTGATAEVSDQWMQVNGGLARSNVKSSYAEVSLHFNDEEYTFYNTNWNAIVTYRAELFDIQNNAIASLANQSLTVGYTITGEYTDHALLQYEEAHRIEIRITDVVVTAGGNTIPTPNDLYLETSVRVQRFYNLATDEAPALTKAVYNPAKQTFDLGWTYVEGAESYDVEFLFIDVASPDELTDPYAFDFRDAIRINLPDNHYEISMAYPRGILLYRMRAMGFTGSDFATPVFSDWTVNQRKGLTTDAVLGPVALPGQLVKTIRQIFLWDGLQLEENWQYSAAYTEFGKRKESFNLFDGSLRSRQSIVSLNSDSSLIVSQTVYDFQGRPALQTLPAPIENKGIDFYENALLRVNDGGTPTDGIYHFNYRNFDRDDFLNDPKAAAGIVVAGNDPAANLIGPGNYYSPQNPGTGINGQYTPDAEGFPYSRTTYKNDGTDRVRTQGNVGETFKTGDGRETQYFYGNPGSQTELDRLFGNEAGFFSQYKKTMVIDPNGQATIAYIDQSGRTVATGLTGNSPDNLLDIDTKMKPISINGDLTALNTLTNNNEWVATQTFVVAEPTTYTFDYNLQGQDFCSSCADVGPTFVPGCLDCEYELTIRLLDEFRENVGNVNVRVNGASSPILPTNLLITSTTAVEIEVNITVPGSYTIEKILTLREENLPAVQQYFINNFECEVPDLPISSCPTCNEECADLYSFVSSNSGLIYFRDEAGVFHGTEDPVTGAIVDFQDPNTPPAANFGVAYIKSLITACNGDCPTDTPEDLPVDRCATIEAALIRDVSPGGQYFDNLPAEFIAGNPNPNYLESGTNTGEINGWLEVQTVVVDPTSGTTQTLLEYLNEQADITIDNWNRVRDQFEPAWADILVKQHPEYCAFQALCNEGCKTTSDDFTNLSLLAYPDMVVTVNPANVNFGAPYNELLFNPLNLGQNSSATQPQAYQPFANGTNGDPILDNAIENRCQLNDQSIRTTLANNLQNFLTDNSGVTYSIWYWLDPITAQNVLNAGPSGNNLYDVFDQLHNPTTGILATQQIDAYTLFRSIYLGFRQQIIQDIVIDRNCTDPNTLDALADEGFSLYFPFSNLDTDVNQFVQDELVDGPCGDACEQRANATIAEYESCITNVGAREALRQTLIDICILGCQVSPIGSSEGNGTPVNGFDNWEDAINDVVAMSGICPTPVQIEAFPDASVFEQYDQATCACEQIEAFLVATEVQDDANPAAAIFTNAENLDLLNEQLDGSETLNQIQLAALINHCRNNLNATPPTQPDYTFLENNGLIESFSCPAEQVSGPAGESDCDTEATAASLYFINQAFERMVADRAVAFAEAYRTNCFAGIETRETFTVGYELDEYHYTLYYYDQAGNLVKTVPPAGLFRVDHSGNLAPGNKPAVHNSIIPSQNAPELSDPMLYPAGYSGPFLEDVTAFRAVQTPFGVPNPPGVDYVRPNHDLETRYEYNSLNLLVRQETPDGGETFFFYDALDRLVVSQNAKQAVHQDDPNDFTPQYSYTIYDELSRVIEVGEITTNAPMNYDLARTPTAYAAWLNSGEREEVTRTFYDDAHPLANDNTFGWANQFPEGQDQLRNRISTLTYVEQYNAQNPDNFDFASHYSYDLHGNVVDFVNQNNALLDLGQHQKYTHYEFDLVSGNVNEVQYQPGKFDEFYHRYVYDADNRVTEAFTSRDGTIFERDQKYFYYAHLPMARKETGEQQVQACDYVYALQGWLKGENSSLLLANNDPGKDGRILTATQGGSLATSGLNTGFGTDAVGYTLGYYNGDYKAINPGFSTGSITGFEASVANNTTVAAVDRELFNGNISHMTTALTNADPNSPTVGETLPQLMSYQYDQLNRIKNARSTTDVDALGNAWNSDPNMNASPYRTNYEFDGNGNLMKLGRFADNAAQMDRLTYEYLEENGRATNKLNHVNDGITNTLFSNDIDDQGVFDPADPTNNNYVYDNIGQLVSDEGETIERILWSVRNKVRHVLRNGLPMADGSFPPDLEFQYDANGMRIWKIVKPRNDQGELLSQSAWKYTYYSCDPSGNVQAVYDRNLQEPKTAGDPFTDTYTVQEHHIYGTERAGIFNNGASVTQNFTTNGTAVLFPTDGSGPLPGQTVFANVIRDPAVPDDSDNHDAGFGNTIATNLFARTLGQKAYELKNHLGNVLTTVSDRKIGNGSVPFSQVSNYTADLISVSDYYPYGMQMEGERSFTSSRYRYGFQGQEHDDEVQGSGNFIQFQYRVHDPRVGRFLSRDPLFRSYPHNSPYAFAENRVVRFVELEGLEIGLGKSDGYYYTSKGGDIVPGVTEDDDVIYDAAFERMNGYGTVFNGSWVIPNIDGLNMADPNDQAIFYEEKRIAETNMAATEYVAVAADAGLGSLAIIPSAGVLIKEFEVFASPLAKMWSKVKGPFQKVGSAIEQKFSGVKKFFKKFEFDFSTTNSGVNPNSIKYRSGTYKAEASLTRKPTKTHGFKWSDNDAIKRAKDTGNPQGRFGSKADADYAVSKAQELKVGERRLIEAPSGTSNEIIMPDGSKKPATHIFIEVKPAGKTGTIHAFPVEEGYKITPRKGF